MKKTITPEKIWFKLEDSGGISGYSIYRNSEDIEVHIQEIYPIGEKGTKTYLQSKRELISKDETMTIVDFQEAQTYTAIVYKLYLEDDSPTKDIVEYTEQMAYFLNEEAGNKKIAGGI